MPAIYFLFISLMGCSIDKGIPMKEIVRFRNGDAYLEGVLPPPWKLR